MGILFHAIKSRDRPLTGVLILSFAEKIEIAAIPVAAGVALWLGPANRIQVELGEGIAGLALLILLQGLCRDLWLLSQAKQTPATAGREARCMCVESAIGLTGVVVGIGLVGVGLDSNISFSASGLAASIALAMTTGFLLKDVVFEWSPWRIYREKNHARVIFRWDKPTR